MITSGLLALLAKLADEENDPELAISCYKKAFSTQPNVENYKNLKALAKQYKQWNGLKDWAVTVAEQAAFAPMKINIA